MFDLIFSAFQAYTQIGMFIGSAVCLGLGGLMLGNALYWRVHALRASGTIIGVIPNGGTYTPVYRYTLPSGEMHEAKSDTSTGMLSAYKTGRVVPLMISWHNPSKARSANNFLLDIFGLIILAPGVLLGYFALTAYPITRMTWIMAGVMLLYLAERGYRLILPKAQRLSLKEWKERHNIGRATAIDLATVKPAEDILKTADMQQTLEKQRQQNKWVMPILAVFGLGLMIGGVYLGYRTVQFEARGLRAPGEVIRLQEEESGDSRSYYPVVRFRTGQDEAIEFKDSFGSNPPSYRSGDKVTVLFLEENPQRNAMIDHGVWNWVVPAGLLLFGVFLVWICLVTWRSERQPNALSPA